MKRNHFVSLAVAIMLYPVFALPGGSEIGNGRSWKEIAPIPMPGAPAPMPGSDQHYANQVLQEIAYSTTEIPEGGALVVKVGVPAKPGSDRIMTCKAAFTSPQLEFTRILADECSAVRVSPEKDELTIRLIFPARTVGRSYFLSEISWQSGSGGDSGRPAVATELKVKGSVPARPPKQVSPEMRTRTPGYVRIAENFATILRFTGLPFAIVNAELQLRVQQGAFNDERWSFVDLPLRSDLVPGDWVTEVQQRELSLLSREFIVHARVPEEHQEVSRVELSALVMLTEAWQEVVIVFEPGFGLDVR